MAKYNTTPTQEELDRRRAFHSGEQRQFHGLKNFELWNSVFPSGYSASLPSVSETTAQKLSVVFTCLNVLGETVGSLPCEVKKNTPDGRVTVYDRVYRLVHDRPNPLMTAFTFWSTIEKHRKAWGNAYVEILRDGRMNPVSLWLLMPWDVTYSVHPNGERYYKHIDRTLNSSDILHFKNYSHDGYCGVSTIKQNALSISMGLKLKEYNAKVVDDRPPGFLTSKDVKPKNLQQKENIQGLWTNKSAQGQTTINPSTGVQVTAALGIPFLYGGVEYQQLSLPADDVAFIESTNLTNKDIYGIFRVPPTFGQDWENTPYNGAEQQDIVFAKYTLASIRDMEQECTEKLFPESNKTADESLYIKFNLKGLLAGDTATRKEFYNTLFNIGVMSANDIREREDLTKVEKGDVYYVQGALVPVDLIGEFVKSKIKASNNKSQKTEQVADQAKREVKELLKKEMKSRLNGHFQDVEELLQ